MNTVGKIAFFGVLAAVVMAAIAVSAMRFRTEPKSVPQPALPDPNVDTGSGEGGILPVLALCPDFRLADLAGAPFGLDHVLGRAWITNVLPSNSATQRSALAFLTDLQKQLKETKLALDTRIVTFVATANDGGSNDVQAAVKKAGGDLKQWYFVRGTEEQMASTLEGLGLTGDAAEKVLLVDPQGHVRMHYGIESTGAKESLIRDVRVAIDERVLVLENAIDPPSQVRTVIDPPWLDVLKNAQLQTRKNFDVFIDFSFADLRKESGILFRHRIVDDAGRSLVTAHYDHGNGIAAADVDADGFLDVYFVNQVGGSQLWRNLGDGRFENITEKAGVALRERIGVTASFADIDNDGDPDLYVTTVRGGNAMFQNEGQGNFKDITESAGLAYSGHSSSAEFFDYDRDGLLDLFLVNVGIYTKDTLAVVAKDRFTGPDTQDYSYYVSYADAFAAHLKPNRVERSILYRNLGENRFQDVSEETKLMDLNWTGDATPLDANQDGWPDLYLVNMQGHDEYYENVEGKYFERKGRDLFPASPWGSMGVKVFDFNNDGKMDIYVTDMHTDMAKPLAPINEKDKIPKDAFDVDLLGTDGNHVMGNAFFVNRGPGQYEELSDVLGVETYWPWGLSTGDLNADGFEDIFVTGCMNFPYRYAVNSVLLNNNGNRFMNSEFLLGVEPRRGRRTATPWFELDVANKDSEHPLSKLLHSKHRSVKN